MTPPTWSTGLLVVWCLAHLVFQLWFMPAGHEPALADSLGVLCELHQGSDSWHHMIAAYQEGAGGGQANLYTTVVFDREIKATYPPTALLPFVAFEAWGVRPPDWPLALLATSYVAYLLLAGVLVALLWKATAAWGGPDQMHRPLERGGLALAAVLACLTFFPVTQGLSNGQVQLWITLAMGLALLCWLADRRAWSGACLAVAALLKPHYALVLAWGLMRREWGLVSAFCGVAAAAVAVSWWRFGIASHLNYLDVMRFFSTHIELKQSNQSLAGILYRLRGDEGPGVWFPTFDLWTHGALGVFAVALLAAALLLPSRGGWRGDVFDLGIMLASLTLISPIAWRHHYGVFLPLFALAFVYLAASRPAPRVRWGLLAACYLLIGTAWNAPKAPYGSWLGLGDAAMFFGGVAMLALLHGLRREAPLTAGAPEPLPVVRA